MDLAHPSPSRGFEASWRRSGRVPALAPRSPGPEPGTRREPGRRAGARAANCRLVGVRPRIGLWTQRPLSLLALEARHGLLSWRVSPFGAKPWREMYGIAEAIAIAPGR